MKVIDDCIQVLINWAWGSCGSVAYLKPGFQLSSFKYCVKLLLQMAPTNTEKIKPLTFCYLNWDFACCSPLVTWFTFLCYMSQGSRVQINISKVHRKNILSKNWREWGYIPHLCHLCRIVGVTSVSNMHEEHA